MKRAAIILLLICYLIPSIGIKVYAHYCGGKLSSVSLQVSKSKQCGCEDMEMDENCCKTKTCSISIKEVQEATPQLFTDFSKLFSATYVILLSNNTSLFTLGNESVVYNNHHPPSQLKYPIYLCNRVFRI